MFFERRREEISESTEASDPSEGASGEAATGSPASDDVCTMPNFPTRQMIILALCRICEPIAFMSIFPYVYYMIDSFDIASSQKQIAVYAGMVTSAFAFAEFCSGVAWGRLSDVVGRKPVLLMGLLGTGISMLFFGFARSFHVALFARALGGLLNGNIGVLQTTVAELVTNDSHRPRAFSIMPFIWCLGGIIGASIGGSLSDPVQNLGFGRGTVLETFPYLLPNVVCTAIVLISLLIGILFMEETHDEKKYRRDYGIEIGRRLLSCRGPKYSPIASNNAGSEDGSSEEQSALMYEKSSFQSNETTPRTSTEYVGKQSLDAEMASPSGAASSAISAFSVQILLNIASYGVLAYHTILFDQMLPIFLSMDETAEEIRLPFKFSGGFGLRSTTIGLILSLQGIYQMAAQIIIFPLVVKRVGRLRLFRICALTYPILYTVVPYLTLLSATWRMPVLCLVLVWKVTFSSMAYPCNNLLLNDNAPSKLVLGLINGVAASAASLARALGPTLSGMIQSYGLSRGYLGLPWWAGALIAALGGVISLFMQDMKAKRSTALGSSR